MTSFARSFDPADLRGLARLLSRIEAHGPDFLTLLRDLHAARRPARVLGVTGPPGAGKSTLVDQLIARIRARNERVAVIAVDPSSPFSGGAVLGDRIRMQRHAGDTGVFIRSVGSRGAHGGLSRAARALVTACEAYRFDWVIIETVGVGQSEFDIMELAETTLVVLVPEAGDTVQTLKAGLFEVADIFVVNKNDRPGADQMARALESMLGLGASTAWRVPVLTTTATTGEGVEAVTAAIERHHTECAEDPTRRARRAALRRHEFLDLCAAQLRDRLEEKLAASAPMQRVVAQIESGEANPYECVESMVRAYAD